MPASLDLWLFDGAAKSVLLLAVAAGIALLLRRRAAATRHGLWAIALIGLLAVPSVTAVVASWRLPALPHPVIAHVSPPAAARHASVPMNPGEPAFAPDATRLDAGSSSPSSPTAGTAAATSWSAGTWWLLAWATGTALLLIRSLVGVIRTTRLARRARPVDDPTWRALHATLGRELALPRSVRLLVDPRVAAPMTVGVLRPVVLLPVTCTTWSASRRRIVLLHELLHIKRRDWLVQMLACVARAVYWFNPLAWLAVRRLHLECEQSCDERVVRWGVRPSAYAACLLDVARDSRGGRHPAAVGLLNPSILERRVMNVLTPTRSRERFPLTPCVALATLTLFAFALGAMSPTAARAVAAFPADDTHDPGDALAGLAVREFEQRLPIAGDAVVRLGHRLGNIVLEQGDVEAVTITTRLYADAELGDRLADVTWQRRVDADGRSEWQLVGVLDDATRLRYPRLHPDSRSTTTWNDETLEIVGAADAPVLFADLRVVAPRGSDLALRSGLGDIEGGDLRGALSVSGSGGAIAIERIEGALDVLNGAGAVTVGSLVGRVAVVCGAGPVRIDDGRLERLEIDAGAGPVTVRSRAIDAGRVHAGAGRVRVQTDLAASGTLELTSGAGAVELFGGSKAGFHLTASTGVGSFRNGYADASVERHGNVAIVRCGGEDARITMSTGAGSCLIAPAPEDDLTGSPDTTG